MHKSSFSIVDGDDSDNNVSNSDTEFQEIDRKNSKQFKYLNKLEAVKIDDDSEDGVTSPRKKSSAKNFEKLRDRKKLIFQSDIDKISKKNLSDSEEETDNEDDKAIKVSNEYNPNSYAHLEVEDEVKELFQYIVKYMPQQLTLECKFKPFIPEYLPAVGDIDAFLKVIPPENQIDGENLNLQDQQLGFAILDEPASSQSDSALLHLQLRASSIGVPQDSTDVVKIVDKVDKNQKIIHKWIKDISDLHKSKSSPVVHYSQPMPDIDDLMQEWSEEMENRLKVHGFPEPESDTTITEYAELVCDIFQIPTGKNIIHSLYLLFSLYAAVKDCKFYRPFEKSQDDNTNDHPDQLVLD